MTGPARGKPGSWEHLALWTAPGVLDLDATLATLPASERDASDLVASMWPGELHYVPSAGGRPGTWYIWDGRCHRPDTSAEIARRIIWLTKMLDKVFEEARKQVRAEEITRQPADPEAAEAEADQRWALWEKSVQFKWARNLRKTAPARALEGWLGGPFGVSPEVMADHHPGLVNAANCMVSLDAPDGDDGWYPHDPQLLMTYVVEANWQPYREGEKPGWNCPEFVAMAHHMCGGDWEVTTYFIHALGYALLGANPYQLVFFISGNTNNGKSKLLEIVSTVLGPALAYEAKPDLIASKVGDRARHSRHEASMEGRRLITISETNDQLYIDEMQLKRLTGQAQLSIDIIWRPAMTTIDVAGTIFVGNNDMPSVAHLDDALTRRINVIPAEGATVPVEHRDSTKVARIVAAERDGILQLLAWACRKVMASQGRLLMQPPAAVVAKTDDWRRKQDTVRLWMAECTAAANGSAPAQRAAACYRDYIDWCGSFDKNSPVIALGRNHFNNALSDQPGVVRTGPDDQAWFRGFMLKNPPLDD